MKPHPSHRLERASAKRTLIYLTVVSFVALTVAAPASADSTVTVTPASAPSVFKDLFGVPLHPSSCLNFPRRPECPVVTAIIFALPSATSNGEDETGYGVLPSRRANAGVPTRTLATHGIPPGWACAVIGHNPTRGSYSSSQGIDYFVDGKSENSCRLGIGVIHMEVTSTLYRDDPRDSDGFQPVATASNSTGCCDVSATAHKNCNHPGAWPWYTFAYAAHTRTNGLTYFGSDRSSTVEKSCPDSY